MDKVALADLAFKVLREDGRAPYSYKKWHLPTPRVDEEGNTIEGEWEPGKWMPKLRAPLEMCARGYHLTNANSLCNWSGYYRVTYIAEWEGSRLDSGDKFCVQRARLLRPLVGRPKNWYSTGSVKYWLRKNGVKVV